MCTTETIAVISAVTALLAVLLSPLVSLWSAQRQSRVTVLSANRQAWINTLRDLIAEYISITGLMQGNGRITGRGVQTPDEAVPFGAYVSELQKRGVEIREIA